MQNPVTIPDKLYFKIGEVSDLVGVKAYVLRYWESEFKEIAPVKSQSNQRLYRRKDVEILLRVKHLLYREKYTINGAKKVLKEEFSHHAGSNNGSKQLDFGLAAGPAFQAESKMKILDSLRAIQSEMQEALKILQ